MRGALQRRLTNPYPFTISSILKQSSSHFSSDTSGRGRGRGSNAPQFNNESQPPPPPTSYGHGRGHPIQPNPISNFTKPDFPITGRGRGSITSEPVYTQSPPVSSPPNPQSQTQQPKLPNVESISSKPNFPITGRGRGSITSEPVYTQPPPVPSPPNPQSQTQQPKTPNVESTQTQPLKTPVFTQLNDIKEEALSVEAKAKPDNIFNALGNESSSLDTVAAPRQRLSAEEAGRRARSELSRGEAVTEASGGRGGGRGRGRGRGMRGGRGGGRGRGGGDGYGNDKKEGEAEQEAMSVFAGDNADGEKFANAMGPELMKELADGFEAVCEKALPSTGREAYIDAYDTNCMIEFEPEYIMPDFGSNPDIEEKPPMSLTECLEKVKPFIMCYEGIKDQEEWEGAVAEVMAQAPLLKEIVDHYSGPDRVTAKRQNEELDRIATTIPKTAPDSVKRFADRAALSLKSNPGWGFDKKYKFMDKLVMEVSQCYK